MPELIKNFGIDWKILLAQAVNFFVLLFILKKFAYGPVMRMLRKRKEDIEKGLKFTKEAGEKLERIGEEREVVLKEARGEALSIVREAEATGKVRKDEIVAEAAKKGESIITDAKRAIAEEKAKMGEEVYRNAEGLICLGVTKVLGKMSPEERDAILIKEALQELKTAVK